MKHLNTKDPYRLFEYFMLFWSLISTILFLYRGNWQTATWAFNCFVWVLIARNRQLEN